MDSENFSVEQPTFTGGVMSDTSSENFAAEGTFGESVVGDGTSGNFISETGFDHDAEGTTQTPTTPSVSDGGSRSGSSSGRPNAQTSHGLSEYCDVNADNHINLLDFNAIMVAWGGVPSRADCNQDMRVDVFDIYHVLLEWRE